MPVRRTRIVLALSALLAGLAQAQSVTPPPLPPGSLMARPEPGMSEPEAKRAVRAHHHKFHHGKDVTRDDSVLGHESESPDALRAVSTRAAAPRSMAPGAVAGSASAVPGQVPGGAGTGPAREKTDKGASSYFFGNNKK